MDAAVDRVSALEAPDVVGETTLTGKNQISLPARGIRRLGWGRGDRLIVTIMSDDTLLLRRRPTSWTEAFAGGMSDVFGTHDETMRELEEERRSWDEWAESRGV